MTHSRRDFIKIGGLSIIPLSAGCIDSTNSVEIENSKDLILEPNVLKSQFDLNWVKATVVEIDMDNSLSSHEIHILSPDNGGSGITHQLGIYDTKESCIEQYGKFRSASSNTSNINIGDGGFYFGSEGSTNYATIYSHYERMIIKTIGAPFSVDELSSISIEQVDKIKRVLES